MKQAPIKSHLLTLSHELTKIKPNKKKIQELLKKTGIPESNDPFVITNEILKRLHQHEATDK